MNRVRGEETQTAGWGDWLTRYVRSATLQYRDVCHQRGLTGTDGPEPFGASGDALHVRPAALLVRTFVLMHDCAHGSFFTSRRANRVVGAVTGVLTLMPFEHWRHEHALHHASAGDLDRRGHGDVPTLTVREYLARSRWGRLCYRFTRDPLAFLLVGPLLFVLEKRLPPRGPNAGRRQIVSVWTTNATIVLIGGALITLLGPRVLLV